MSSQMFTLEEATWAWINTGPIKHKAPIGKRFLKGFMAGLFLSMGGMLVNILSADPWLSTNAPGLLKIIQGACFPVGLVMIVLLQADLVTGAMAIMILSTLKRKVPFWAFAVDWTIVFIGNLSGALFYAGLLVYYTEIYTEAMVTGSAATATSKAGPAINFRENFLRGIGCNVLVCIAVFQASLAKDVISKIVASWFPIFVFVSAGFEHVVASMFLIPEGLMQGSPVSVGRYIWNAMIPAFLGNILGAALLVLPLLYLYGDDEHDPLQVSGETLPTTNGIQSTGYTKDAESADGSRPSN
ncbi:Formate/nitrite transporter [Microstroma glucosiphilum]|uniref:Formate/nitrite transporter n=1 Tax=Pseudomicrostroma glucosiphilum TaxID=1684307 RepID=A0A316U4R2_9BASI|nr:Formate/nitrite transporter [Pseudomicrostroma glucosiphilum]PWN19323.1 Formate/nitrite transporter [Pseudomicrostroma glucosiphilum]